MKLITLFLTCKDKEEATEITQALLGDKLVACIKQAPVKSEFYWQGDHEEANEILLIMDSTEDRFEAIEKRVKEVHSYDTFVLNAVPIIKASAGVEEWVNEATK